MNIYQKLLAIQKQVIGLGKNKDGHNYKYVTGEKVLEHIKPLMNEHGLLLKQEVISIENTRQDFKTKYAENSEINSKVMMRFTWVDCETGEKDENMFGANGQNAWDKGVGSALTYGERYFLLKFFHIATDEDDIDNPERKQEAPVSNAASQPVGEKPKTKEQETKIFDLLINAHITAEESKTIQGNLPNMTEAKATEIITWLQKQITKRSKPVTAQ